MFYKYKSRATLQDFQKAPDAEEAPPLRGRAHILLLAGGLKEGTALLILEYVKTSPPIWGKYYEKVFLLLKRDS